MLHLKDGKALKRARSVLSLTAERTQADPESYRIYTYREGGLHHGDRIVADSIVLDVDLDYFCWDDSLMSVPDKRIEITEEAYEGFRADRYHPLRLMPVSQFSVTKDEGRYYLVYREGNLRDPLPNDRLILKRMDRLFQYLAEQGVRPKAIDVCRSSISGFLPSEKAAFVEESFMERLEQTYPLKMVDIALLQTA